MDDDENVYERILCGEILSDEDDRLIRMRDGWAYLSDGNWKKMGVSRE